MNELPRETIERYWLEALNGGAPVEEEGEPELAIELEGSAPTRIKEECR